MGRLEGKVAFITGAGAGIAKAAALMFSHEGAKVALAEINRELGEAAEARHRRGRGALREDRRDHELRRRVADGRRTGA